MVDTVIEIENLSKLYRIGSKEERTDTLIGAITHVMLGPIRRFRTLRRLSKFGKDVENGKDTIWALRNISLTIGRGEVVGFIGRNGAGKSTLLKILSGITEPTEGRAVIKGRMGTLLEVGTGFHPELTGRENVYLNGTILGMKKKEIESVFDEIVEFAGVEKFIETPVKRYSSGMRVRLAFAVAAHLQPEILLIDEVLAVGDAAFQRKCLGKMHDVATAGRTVLFVSHKMASVKSLCDRVYWLEQGKIKEEGDAEEVVNRYELEVISDLVDRCRDGVAYVNLDEGLILEKIVAVVEEYEGGHHLIISIKGKALREHRQLGFGMQVKTLDGIILFRAGPGIIRSEVQSVKGEWTAKFKVRNVTSYLVGGEYVLHIRVRRLGSVIIDANEAAIVRIPEIDVYRSGKALSISRNGFVPLPVEFVFEGINGLG